MIMSSEIPWVKDEDGDLIHHTDADGVQIIIAKELDGKFTVRVFTSSARGLTFPTLEEAKAAVPGEIGKVIDALASLLDDRGKVAVAETLLTDYRKNCKSIQGSVLTAMYDFGREFEMARVGYWSNAVKFLADKAIKQAKIEVLQELLDADFTIINAYGKAGLNGDVLRAKLKELKT
jgi:hypothetical protein